MIVLNDFRRQWEDNRESALDAFMRVGQSGWYILGECVREFELSLASAWGARHCVGVASGMDAIEIGLQVAGCRPGDRVVTTPLSAFATTLAILRVGAIPVFVDTDPFGLLDLEACRRVLRTRRDISFVLPVHLYGNAVDYHGLRQLQDEFGIRVIEDCAQSILAASHGHPAGTAGVLAATSFYPTKNLGAMGDGGAILTDLETLAQTARVMRDYGQTAKYQHERVGYNSRLDELQAALLKDVLLPRLKRYTARRTQVARQYLDGIDNRAIRCLGSPASSDSCWHLFPVLVNPGQKRDFMAYLNKNEIGCGEHYPILIPCQRAMTGRAYEVSGDCQTAASIAQSEVSLPIHPYLTDAEVARVIDVCNGWQA